MYQLNFSQCANHEPHEQVVSEVPLIFLSFIVPTSLCAESNATPFGIRLVAPVQANLPAHLVCVYWGSQDNWCQESLQEACGSQQCHS